MNPSATYYEGQNRDIDPYYVKGDVFQRDPRYYEQVISSRRNRAPNSNQYNQNFYNSVPNPGANSNTSNPYGATQPNVTVNPPPIYTPPVQQTQIINDNP